MQFTSNVSEEIPFFLRLWVKWHLRKYVGLMAKKLADIRDRAMRELINLKIDNNNNIVYRTKYTTKAEKQFINEATALQEKFMKDTVFIAEPPRPFPMSKVMCKWRIRQNRKSIEKFEETIDRHPFFMINGYSVLSMAYPADKVAAKEMDDKYKALHRERTVLSEIYVNEIPNKIPAYKKAVKQLIKEIA